MKKGLLLLFVLLLLTSLVQAATDEQLNTQLEQNLTLKRQVFQETLSFIEKNPDLPEVASLYSNLAELSASINLAHPEITLHYYQLVLQKNKNFREKDKILYNIGFYTAQTVLNRVNEGRIHAIQRNPSIAINYPDSLRVTYREMQPAIDAYDELIKDYPISAYRSESIFRLAIVYYQIGLDAERPVLYYQKASELFDILANRSKDSLQYLGLFQSGWANISSGLYEKSFADFSKILSIITNPDLKLQKVYFEDASIENVAYSLVNMDRNDFVSSSVGATYAISQIPKSLNEYYGKKILLEAVRLKKNLNAPMQAIDFYNAYLTIYPNGLENPSLIDSITIVYTTHPNGLRPNMILKDEILTQKERIISTFSKGSAWYQANQSNDLTAPMKIIRDAFTFLEPYYWNDYYKNKTTASFQKYENLITKFEETPELLDPVGKAWVAERAQKVILANYDLAENQNNPQLYYSLNQKIYKFNQDFPENSSYFQNERNAFICIEKLQDLLKDKFVNGTYEDSTKTFSITSAVVDTLYNQGAVRYLGVLRSEKNTDTNKDEEIIHVLYGRSQLLQKIGDYSGATRDLLEISNYTLPNNQRRDIFIQLAVLSEKLNSFDQASAYYKKAETYALGAEDKKTIHANYLVQMNNQADFLKSGNDLSKAAEEYLRLANEFENTDKERVIGYKIEAQNLYKQSGMYQKSIDLLLDITQYKTNVSDIYQLYGNAWTIADSLLADSTQSDKLKKDFVAKYPKSVEAYQTRLAMIHQVAQNKSNNDLAADMYLDLYNDAAARRIDIGNDPIEDLYLLAIKQYQDQGNEAKVAELSRNFARLHPNSPKALSLLEYVATKYKDSGNNEEYHKMALEIYKKDPNSKLLADLANVELKQIYDAASAAYAAKDWTTVFAKSAEFKKVDTAYQKEGLTLPLTSVYEDFAAYKIDYDAEMANLKFMKTFDDKLASIENGFVKLQAGSLLIVNDKTTWKQRLDGGDKRIQGLVDLANKNKDEVEKLLRTSNEYNLDTQRRTKAIYLIGMIYDHAATVLDTQIEKYLTISREIIDLKANPEYYEKVVTMVRNTKSDYVLGFQDAEAFYYTYMLKTFAESTGYSDANIEKATEKLTELNKLPLYDITESALDNSWKVSNEPLDEAQSLAKIEYSASVTTGSKFILGSIKIPAHQSVTINKDVSFTGLPSMAYLHIATNNVILLSVNMQPSDVQPEILDTVMVNGTQVNHSLFRIDGQSFAEGLNRIEIKLGNETDTDQYFAANLQIYFEKQATSSLPATDPVLVQEKR